MIFSKPRDLRDVVALSVCAGLGLADFEEELLFGCRRWRDRVEGHRELGHGCVGMGEGGGALGAAGGQVLAQSAASPGSSESAA